MSVYGLYGQFMDTSGDEESVTGLTCNKYVTFELGGKLCIKGKHGVDWLHRVTRCISQSRELPDYANLHL